MKNEIDFDFQDNKTEANRLKGTRDFEIRERNYKIWFWFCWIMLVVALCLFYSVSITCHAMTRQQRLDQYLKQSQLANNIPQWKVVITKI